MNSNAADVNVSALLNLGARPRMDKTISEPSERKDSFERHLSEQASKTDRAQKRSIEPQARAAGPDASESASDSSAESDAEAVKADKSATSSQKESTGENGSSGQREGDTNTNTSEEATEAVPAAASEPQSQVDDLPDNVEIDEALIRVSEEAVLVNNTTQTDDLLIDVPAQASISLENLVTAVADEQSSAGEAVGAALDLLVDGLEPIAAEAATASAQVANKPISAQAVPTPVVTTAPRAGEKTLIEGELDVDPAELERIVSTIDTKGGAAKALDLTQSSSSVIEPSRQTLNQQMVSALTGATASVAANDQQSKLDLSSSAKEPAALVAVSQRVAARPVSVQQGSAQFSMPSQAKPGQPQWQTAVAERVAIMATQRITSAEIQLDPPELGQLQVRVTLNQDQASVSFASQHAVVREALDQTAHRLREMFDSEGLNLVDVDVSDQSFQQQREDAQANSVAGDAGGDDEPIDEPVVTTISQGLVDHFV